MTRELANEFNDNEMSAFRRLVKRKHDPEEVREIDLKADARRRKAYKNYEDSCKISGKFTVRSCPKLEECYTKNKLKLIPLLSQNKTAPAPTTVKPTTIASGSVKQIINVFDPKKRN